MKTAHRTRRVAALALTFLTGFGVTTVAAPAADAQTNRRICTYSGVQTWYSASGVVTSYSQWVMNYKKKDGCPTNGNRDSLYYVKWYLNGSPTTFTDHGHY